MEPLDENLPAEGVDEAEPQGELDEEDKNFLKDLEKMVEEVEDDVDSID